MCHRMPLHRVCLLKASSFHITLIYPAASSMCSSPVKLQHELLDSQWTEAQGVDHSLKSSSELHSHTSGLNHTAVTSVNNQFTLFNYTQLKSNTIYLLITWNQK